MDYILVFLLPIAPVLLSIFYIRRYSGKIAIDPGIIFTWIIFLYAWFPLVGIILASNNIGIILEKRLVDNFPSHHELFNVGLNYLAFLVGFAWFYYKVRRWSYSTLLFLRPKRDEVIAIILLTVILFLLVSILWEYISSDVITKYGETYTRYRKLPHLTAQIMGILGEFKFSMIVFSIVIFILWRPYWHKYMAVFLLCLLFLGLILGGSRSLYFLSLFTYVVCYSIFIKPLSLSRFVLISSSGLLLFFIAGMIRQVSIESETFILPLFQRGELVSVFANSIDLQRLIDEASMPLLDWRIYFVDLVGWIPQQLLWFDKLDLSTWYTKTYYPDYFNNGGGLVFGSIAESVMGFGFFEAFIRGSLLGICYAMVANYCLSGLVSVVKAFVYVWFIVIAYQGIRDTTFVVFPRFILHVMPLIMVYIIIKKMIDGKLWDRVLQRSTNKNSQ